MRTVNQGLEHTDAAPFNAARIRRHLDGKSTCQRGKMIDREPEAVIHFASSLKATAPEIAPGAFLCCSDTRQWVMEAGYFQTRPNTDQRAHPDSRGPADR